VSGKIFGLVSGVWLLMSLSAIAIIDTNQNGLSDLWEKQFNSEQLFPSTYDPHADADADGWTNLQEANAGTNPTDTNAPNGIILPAITYHAAVHGSLDENGVPILISAETATVTWPSLAGKQYRVHFSQDLSAGDWLPVGDAFIGNGGVIEYNITLTQPDGSEPDKIFWKVAISDVDSDNDELSNYEEHLIGTNPSSPDSDLDGITDAADPTPLVNNAIYDPDGENLPAGISSSLRGFWDFETQLGTAFPAVLPDRSGANRHASSYSGGPQTGGLPSKAGEISPQPITIPHATVQGQTSWTISGWLKLAKDGIVNSGPGYKVVYALYDLQGFGPAPQYAQLGQGTILAVAKTGNTETWFVGGYQQTVYYNEPPYSNGNQKTVYNGHGFSLPVGTTDDGGWHHFAVTRSSTANGQKVYFDGVLIFQGNLLDYPVAHDADTTFTLGRLYPAHTPSVLPAAWVDRLRVHSRLLSQSEITALHLQDIDRDGLWDITENSTLYPDYQGTVAYHPDPADPNAPTPTQTGYARSPFIYSGGELDYDQDELNDLSEQQSGTSLTKPDSDGDNLTDGFEVANLFNPLDAYSQAPVGPRDDLGDPDGDSLPTLTEYFNGSNPRHSNTDGDAKGDAAEIAQSSDPANAADGGAAPADPPEPVPFEIYGDYTAWEATIKGKGPHDTRTRRFRMSAHDVAAAQTLNLLRGNAYEMSMRYIRTKPGEDVPWYCWEASIDGKNSSAFTVANHWLVDNQSALLSEHTHSHGTNRIADKKVHILPVELVSRDKFLAGSLRIPDGWTDLELEFGGHEDLGRYGDFMELASTKVFDSIDDLLNSPEPEQPSDQKVWFVRDSDDPRKIYFYTCYNSLGTAELILHPNVGGSSESVIYEHELKAASDFAAIIAYVDQWVKGDLFTADGLGTTWLAFSTTDLAGEIANQARACLIPYFDVIDQVTGLTPLAMGLCDGVRTGIKDDWDFLQLIGSGVVTSAGWVYATASAEIDGWRNDPAMRVKELKIILGDLCTKTVLPHLAALGEKFTSWQGFKEVAWKTWRQVWELDQMIRTIPLASLLLVINGVTSWGDDFCTRMMTGAEKTAWDSTPWDNSPLLVEIELTRNRAWYTFGYTFGYLGEQCVTAAISAGTVTLGIIIAKNGTVLISKLAPRAMGVLAIRLHFIKEALVAMDFADDAARYAHEGMMSSAARQPTTPVIKEIPASLMENRMAAQGFERATFNFKEWVKTAVPDGNVRKLIKSPGGRDVFAQRTSQLMHLLGDECDAVTMKNFMKTAEDRVIVVHPDGTVDEYFEGFFRAFEGNSSLIGDLADPIPSLSAGAKTRLKAFLSAPNPGYLWKIDDPIFVDGVPQIPQNYWTRGVLGELDVFNRVYKKQGYTHAPSAEGYDIFGLKWVQIKTTVNPSSSGNIQAMRNAIDKLVLESPEQATLKLHVLKKPGTDSTALETALDSYIDTPELRNRVEILIEAYNIGPQ
jgi:hypothetical protein